MMASSILAGGVLIVLTGCASAPRAPLPAPAAPAQRNVSPDASHGACPRGGWCDAERGVCIEPDLPERNTFGTDEWLSKAASDVPGHTPNLLHVTYDEWDSLSRHMRISFRGDGWYAIEFPMCRDFPREYIDTIWSFVERETGGAVHRFNRDQWGPLPPGAQPECHTNYNTCCVGCPAADEG